MGNDVLNQVDSGSLALIAVEPEESEFLKLQNLSHKLKKLEVHSVQPVALSEGKPSNRNRYDLHSVLEQVQSDWCLILTPGTKVAAADLTTIIEALHLASAQGISAVAIGTQANIPGISKFARSGLSSEPTHDVDLRRFPEALHATSLGLIMRTQLLREALDALVFDVTADPYGYYLTFAYYQRWDDLTIRFMPSVSVIVNNPELHDAARKAAFREEQTYLEHPRWLGSTVEKILDTDGRLPLVSQYHILYIIFQYFRDNNSAASGAAVLKADLRGRFLASLAKIVGGISKGVLSAQKVVRLPDEWRACLEVLRGTGDFVGTVSVKHVPYVKNGLELEYIFAGDIPEEIVLLKGKPARIEFSKMQTLDFFGVPLLRRRRIIISFNGTLHMLLNGEHVPFRVVGGRRQTLFLRPSLLSRTSRMVKPWRAKRLKVHEKIALRIAHLPVVRRIFHNSWVISDRVVSAKDNGEVFFKYLVANEPSINSWYMLDRKSDCWRRLKREGYGRLVSPGSLLSKLVMSHCAILAASQIGPVYDRSAYRHFSRSDWLFVFLQHGVINRDLSTWLNKMQLDLFVTSTPQESESIVGDSSPYKFHRGEVVLSGLPRHDVLQEKKKALVASGGQQRRLLIAPTWRDWLSSTHRQNAEDVPQEVFSNTAFHDNWSAVLNSEVLQEFCNANNYWLSFLPHPNIIVGERNFRVGDHIEVLSFSEIDVQQVFAEAKIFVTDYSSMAFDAALIGCPVLYFQFDRELVERGGHTGRPGYFDVDRDGFGEVHTSPSALVDALIRVVTQGEKAVYDNRRKRTFTLEPGCASARIVSETKRLLKNS